MWPMPPNTAAEKAVATIMPATAASAEPIRNAAEMTAGLVHHGQQAAHDQRRATQPQHHDRVRQAQPLAGGDRQEARERGCAGGQQDGQEHQRRVRSTLLRTEHEERDRQQGQRRGVQHQPGAGGQWRVAGGAQRLTAVPPRLIR
ncbi:hypothetical protein G6F31_019058 [Rhizopus arrhizus]|nr:hypothetical protein G6F31_019058 [Rhizopus arrhizus]